MNSMGWDLTVIIRMKILSYIKNNMVCTDRCLAPFPALGKHWDIRTQIEMKVCNIYFECIKLFVKMIKNYRQVFLLAITPESGNLIYMFSTFHIKYIPQGNKWGTIVLTGQKWMVGSIHTDLINFSRRFKTNKYDRKFIAERERIEYSLMRILHI